MEEEVLYRFVCRKYTHIAKAAFTSKELREITQLPNTKLHLNVDYLENEIQSHQEILSKDRAKRRLMELLLKGATKFMPTNPDTKSLHLHFLSKPAKINLDPNGQVTSMSLEKTRIDPLNQRAIGTGVFENLDCGLVIKSVGYASERVDPEIPWDARQSIVPNDRGRVDVRCLIDKDNPIESRAICSGMDQTRTHGYYCHHSV